MEEEVSQDGDAEEQRGPAKTCESDHGSVPSREIVEEVLNTLVLGSAMLVGPDERSIDVDRVPGHGARL